MKHIFTLLLLLCCCSAWTSEPSLNDAALSGRVTDEVDGSPLAGVTIRIPETGQGTVTNSEGFYHLAQLPRKRITLQISYLGHQTIIAEVDLRDTHSKDFVMKESNATINEVVITGLTGQQLIKDSPSPISFISASELQSTSSTNIIDAISHQPGIAQITTGSGISKPVIRGLGYNRIVTVSDGVRQEGQQWGDEHGIEVDAQSIAQVEVLKGPASLMYGSDALAGVIILSDEPVLPLGQQKASVSSEYQTNNGLFAYSLGYAGNLDGLVWNARYSEKMAHPYTNKMDGRVLNSQFHERAARFLSGINRSWGYAHLRLSYYNLVPGIVEGDRDEETGQFLRPVFADGEEQERPATRHDLHTYGHLTPYQRVTHYKAVSENNVYVGNGTLKAIIGYQQNVRKEFEEPDAPNEAGLDFLLHTVNYNLNYSVSADNGWKFAGGLGGMWQRSLNRGEEYLIPAYRLFDIGAFATSSWRTGRWNLSGGLRLDRRQLKSYALEDRFSSFSRHFDGLTGSLGAVWSILPDVQLRLNAARGFRSPNMSELGSNGEHEGTLRYEIGNKDLKAEYSWQFDLGLDFSSPVVSVQAALFANLIDNYIFLRSLAPDPAAPMENEFPMAPSVPEEGHHGEDVFSFTQGDARLVGGELSVDFHPVERLHFENSFCWVNAIQLHQPRESRYLPYTPAPRWNSELRYDIFRDGRLLNNTFAKVELECFLRQNHYYAENLTETATPSYTLVNAEVGTDIRHHNRTVATLYLTAQNLFDRAYQNHLSRLKYADENPANGHRGVYNMGRNFGVKLIVPVVF